MALTIIQPDKPILAAGVAYEVVAQDNSLAPGTLIDWYCDDARVQFGKSDVGPWSSTGESTMVQAGQDIITTCYMRWKPTDSQSDDKGTVIHARQQSNQDNAGQRTYSFKVIQFNGATANSRHANNMADLDDKTDPSRHISLTTVVSDLYGNGVPFWEVIYIVLDNRREPTMWASQGSQPSYASSQYTFTADEHGVVHACIGSVTPVITRIMVDSEGVAGTVMTTLALITPQEGTGSSSPQSPHLLGDADPLDLSNTDGSTFAAYIDTSLDSPRPNPSNLTVFILNGEFLVFGTVASFERRNTMLSTRPLKMGGVLENKLSYAVQHSGTCLQSKPLLFPAVGQKHPNPDPNLTRVLTAPSISPVTMVNAVAIENGGLLVTIPPYSNIPQPGLGSLDDVVTLKVYLNAYYSGTDIAYADVVEMTRSPSNDDEIQKGFQILVDNAQLEGYDEGVSAGSGDFQCEYVVYNPRYGATYATRYSKVLGQWPDTIRLGTVLPGEEGPPPPDDE